MVSDSKTFSYAQVERAIAAVLDINAAELGALRGRIKHLRTFELPRVNPVGTGQRVPYTRQNIFTLLLALTLERTGCAPRHASLCATLESLPSKGREFLVFTPGRTERDFSYIECDAASLARHIRPEGGAIVIAIAGLLAAMDRALTAQLR